MFNKAHSDLGEGRSSRKYLQRSNALRRPMEKKCSESDKYSRSNHQKTEVESTHDKQKEKLHAGEIHRDAQGPEDDSQHENSHEFVVHRSWELQVLTEVEIRNLGLPLPEAVLREAPIVRVPQFVNAATNRNSLRATLHRDDTIVLDAPGRLARENFRGMLTRDFRQDDRCLLDAPPEKRDNQGGQGRTAPDSRRKRLVKASSGMAKRVKEMLPRQSSHHT